jgi:phospholipid/cholesterol/gamma-HCH transport system permease protein
MSKKRKSLFSRISIFSKDAGPADGGLFGRHTLADDGLRPVSPRRHSAVFSGTARLGAIGILLRRTMRLLFTGRTDRGETMRMAHRFTNGSLTFVVIAMGFVGMIMIYQSTMQLSRAVGDTTLVGASFLKLLVRVLGPTVIGLLIACRVGAGIAAEIGAMAVTEQLDAMRMCAADPIETLMVPRLRGGIIAGLTLTVVGCAASILAGLLTASYGFGISAATYWNLDIVDNADVIQGITKALLYGIAVPIIAGACGLAARGGARGVGQATTDAVVGSSFAIVLLDSLVSLVAHVTVGT